MTSENEWQDFSKDLNIDEEKNSESIKYHLKFVTSSRPEADAFIAIRDFKLIYTFEGENEGDENVLIERNCRNRTECEVNYDSNFSWSQFGDLPQDKDYLTPYMSNKESTLSLKFHHMVDMDAIIKFEYRISSPEDFVSIESSYGYTLTTLHRTTNVSDNNSPICWFQGEFRLSDLYPPPVMNIMKNLSVNFRFFFDGSEDEKNNHLLVPERASSVAIQLKPEEAIKFVQLKSEDSSPDIGDNLIPALSSENAKWPHWQVPSQRIEVINITDGTGKVIQLSLGDADKFTRTTDGSVRSLVIPSYETFSHWINFLPVGQKYFANVTSNFASATDPPGNWKITATIELSLIQVLYLGEQEGDGDEVEIGHEIFFSDKGNITITSGSPANLLFDAVSGHFGEREPTPARLHVKVSNVSFETSDSHEQIGPVILTIQDLAFGDPCYPENICTNKSKKNKCIPRAVDMPKCNCTNEWRGVNCELPDYCNLVYKGKNGSSHCGKYNQQCKSHDFIPINSNHLPFHCVCNGTDEYWNSDSRRCLKMSNCATVSFCPANHTCVDEPFNSRNPCSACSPGFKQLHDSDICIPIDPCEKSHLHSTTCQSYSSRQNLLEPVTFCPQGYKYNDESGKCDKVDIGSNEWCPEIFRRSLGCQHSCQIEHTPTKDSSFLSVKCNCHEGWAVVDKTRCEHESWFDDRNCGNLCGKNQICIKKGEYQCVCQAGYELESGSTRDCVKIDYCSKSDVSDEIELYCGKGVTSCTESNSNESHPLGEIACNCPDNYEEHKLTLTGPRKPFGCQYKNDLCSLLLPEHRKRGQLCQLIQVSSEDSDTNSLQPVWSCPLGQGVDPETNSCTDLCSIKSNILSCLPKICKVDVLKNETFCDCRAGFIASNDSCLLSTAVYKSSNLTLRVAVDSIDQGSHEEHSNEEKEEEKSKSSETLAVEKFCNKDTDPRNCISLLSQKNVQYLLDFQVVQAKFQSKLGTKVYDAFAQSFGDELPGFQKAIIFNAPQVNLTNSEFFNVQLALIFGLSESNLLPNIPDVEKRIRSLCSKKVTKFPDSPEQFCVLPSGLSISTDMLNSNQLLAELDPCNENSTNYCPHGTECKRLTSLDSNDQHLNGFSYTCQCAHGFRLENSFNFNFAHQSDQSTTSDQLENTRARIEFCVDVDECIERSDPCPVNSTCANLVGSYTCNPLPGFKWSNENHTECISVCSNVTCYNSGSCETSSLSVNDFDCKCQDGWKGRHCEIEDSKVKQLRAALISSVTTLSVILFIAVLAGCISYRR